MALVSDDIFCPFPTIFQPPPFPLINQFISQDFLISFKTYCLSSFLNVIITYHNIDIFVFFTDNSSDKDPLSIHIIVISSLFFMELNIFNVVFFTCFFDFSSLLSHNLALLFCFPLLKRISKLIKNLSLLNLFLSLSESAFLKKIPHSCPKNVSQSSLKIFLK